MRHDNAQPMTSTLNKSRRGTEKRRNRGEFKIAHLRKGSHWARNLHFAHNATSRHPPLHRHPKQRSQASTDKIDRNSVPLTASHCRRSVRPEAPHLNTPRLLAGSHFDVAFGSLLGAVGSQIRTQRRLSARCHCIKVTPLHINNGV